MYCRLHCAVNKASAKAFFDDFFFASRDAEEGQPQRSKKELIALAKEIAAASKEVSTYSSKIAKDCPDKRVSEVGKWNGTVSNL